MSQLFQIHGQLREMILSLDLAPGERLTERWLEGRFEGSRTPIRAALARLESEDLVRRDGRNWMVAPIDLSELEALAEFRELWKPPPSGSPARGPMKPISPRSSRCWMPASPA
jgi:DNA-binding GntR family transcriptional regulator